MLLAEATLRSQIAASPQNAIPADLKPRAMTEQLAPIGQACTLVRVRFVLRRVLLLTLAQASMAVWASATCTAPRNPIEAENCLPGTPSSQWYVAGAGSPNIQGFATDISVNAGQTISFKVSTNAV